MRLRRARGREIDEYDFVGFVHHPVRHGFANADAGDVPHLVVEAFQVLDVHGGEDVDAGVEQCVHVLPAFGVVAAGDVAVGELIHHGDGGLAGAASLR